MSECPTCQLSSNSIHAQIIQNCLKNSSGACPACPKLRALEDKILLARFSLEQLLLERKSLASSLNEHHDALIQRLPVELVSRVFVHSLPFSPGLYVFNSRFSKKEHVGAVLKLGQICRDWRDIAHRTPELWTIFAATITEQNCAISTHMVDNWLKRSGGLPLFMKIHGCKPSTDILVHSIQGAITTIALHTQRCQALDIQIPSTIAPFFSSALSMQSLDRLEHLTVHLEQSFDDGDDLELKASPSVLTFQHGYLNQLNINWSRLTQLISPGQLMVEECILLFKSAPKLLLANLDDVCGPVGHIHQINHPCLQTLLLGSYVGDFWEHFTFLALKTLTIREAGDLQGLNALRDCLHRSGSAITDFSIGEAHGFVGRRRLNGIVEAFNTTPNLQRLSLGRAVACGDLLSAMSAAVKSDVPGFLHELRTLHITTFLQDPPFDWSSLATFLTAMASGERRPLQAAKVCYSDQPTEEEDPNVMSRDMFKLVMDAAHGLEFWVVDVNGSDILERLRRLYSL